MAFYMRRPGSFTLVAEAEGVPGNGVLGFIVAETRRKSGHIITIDVVAGGEARGRRLGFAASGGRSNSAGGCGRGGLETPVNNEAAIRFYKQKGYFVEKTVCGILFGQMDALVMTKELARCRSDDVQPSEFPVEKTARRVWGDRASPQGS